jgi:hypothetical protein
MTRKELQDKTTIENGRVQESETILNDASTTATAAITAATEASPSIPSLQARLKAARDVAVAFQQAAAACVEVQKIEINVRRKHKVKKRKY